MSRQMPAGPPRRGGSEHRLGHRQSGGPSTGRFDLLDLPGGLTAEDLFSAVLQSFPDVTVFVFGWDLRYAAVAGAALTRHGWRAEQLVGRRPRDLLGSGQGASESAAEIEDAMGAALRGEVRRLEQAGIRDPAALWANTVAPLHDDRGRVVGGLIISRDIARLRTAEDARRQLQELAVSAARTAEAERWQRERLEFLVEIDDVLADCRDRRDVMKAVTRAAVPRLGDWCTVHVFLDPRDPVPEVEVAHADPAMVHEAQRIQELLPYDPEATTGMPEVIRTGRPRFHPEIDEEAIERLGLPDPARDAVRNLAIRSAIAVPLVKRHRVIGGMQFIISSGSRRYSEDDLTLAQAVAGRVASSLENHRLTELQRDIARTLQRSLLPEELPEIPWADVAVRYRAAGEGNEVGGDFYDVFRRGPDSHALVIGDVCGNGPSAAALTAMARHTIRAESRRGEDEVGVLHNLNRAMLEAAGEQFCTVVYASLRPTPPGCVATLAVGGHPLPVLVRAGGACSMVGHPGSLLGVFEAVAHRPYRIELRHGDTLVLYTDGASDLPPPHDLDEEEFIRLVAEAVDGSPDAQAAADRVAARLDEHEPFADREDDVALVVVRARSAP